MTLFFSIRSYLQFLWNSKNQHGVHSPFVFDLVTKCFYNKTVFSEYSILKDYRASLYSNENLIQVTDFGAGSRIFKSNFRQISQIAKTAGITPKRAELLFRIVKYFQPNSILEIGTSLGLATSALSVGSPNSKIISLEGCPNTFSQCQLQFQKFNINNVDSINVEFSKYFAQVLPSEVRQLIYLDGNHSQSATLNYFELLLPTVSNESVWIFDDIHWSTDMENAWNKIKSHPKVTVTIDTFQWGIVFFRAEQAKEHFVVRV